MWSGRAWGWFRKLSLDEQLRRKPWVILNDARITLEEAFGLATDDLLLLLRRQLPPRSVLGLAHVSGNVYLAPDAFAPQLTASQTLVANLFSHGEIGLDAVVASRQNLPELQSLRHLQSFERIRYLQVESESSEAEACAASPQLQRLELQAAQATLRPVSRRVLKRHPLLRSVLPVLPGSGGDIGDTGDTGDSGHGTCLQHSNFLHHDISGETLEEQTISCARIAALRGYPPGAGCALHLQVKQSPMLISGSQIMEVSPLQCALVSLSANGLPMDSVLSMAWCGPQHQHLQEQDEELLAQLMPQATINVIAE